MVRSRITREISAFAVRFLGVGSCGLVLLLAGCGTSEDTVPTGTVRGSVVAQGEPVQAGRVNFSSAETGAAGYADLQSDGRFELDGPLPVGMYSIFFTAPGLGDTPPSEDSRTDAPKALENVPKKYQSEATSNLTASVKEGANEFTFELEP